MPFAPRIVSKREDIDEIFQDNTSQVLQKANVSNMIQLLVQLNQVSKYASEVFHDIIDHTSKQKDRLKDCKQRINRLDTKVSPMEKMFFDKSPAYFYDNPYPGKEWKRHDQLKGLIFRRDRASLEVNRRRDEAEAPPNLSILDVYSNTGPCIKKFTDSNFFMNEWMEAEKLKIEDEKKKRKARKKRKKRERTKVNKIQAVKRKQYDPVTGKAYFVEQTDRDVEDYKLTGDVSSADIDREAPSSRSAVAHLANQQQEKKRVKKQAPVFNPVVKEKEEEEEANGNSGGPPVFKPKGGPPAFNPSGGPPKFNAPKVNGGPPAFNPSGPPKFNAPKVNGGPPAQNPYEMESVAEIEIEEPVHVVVPKQKMTAMQMALASRAQQNEEDKRQIPKASNPRMIGKSQLLLSGIKDGVALKKTKPKRKDNRSMLMESLRKGTAKKTLRSVVHQPKPEPKPNANQGIFAILNRRQFVGDSDSDESGSGSWGSEDE